MGLPLTGSFYRDEQDGRDEGDWGWWAPCQARGDVIFAKFLSFPLIFAHLSRAFGGPWG